MAVTDRQILPLTDPTIEVDPMKFEDYESDGDGDENQLASGSSTFKGTENEGRVIPRIQINTAIIKESELSFFSLKMDGFLPTLRIVIEDIGDRFSNIDYPKDGDVISVYIRPEDVENFKEIRIDFDIRSIRFTPGRPNIFTIEGSMKVPGIYAEDCEAFESDTTFNQLNTVADNLGLGYASNEEATEDAMIRIRPYDTNLKFIADLTRQAYKDDDSFWTSYIDLYYYMCFVNVNKQFSEEDEVDDAFLALSVSPNRDGNSEGNDEGLVDRLVLTNQEDAQSTNMYISKYGLINNTGNVWISNGYKRYVQLYDQDLEEWVENFVDPLTTEGSESDKILMKGRADETHYEDQVKYKYLGKQLSGGEQADGYNVHENYIFAQILNYQNLEEIQKMAMTIEMDTVNFNLYRFQRIPILIYNRSEDTKRLSQFRNEQMGEDNLEEEDPDPVEDATAELKNEFLSGYYLISELEYIYRGINTPLGMKLKCLRREWPVPVENKDY